ncbi:MAG: hypothetical protein QM763_03915 [Agriterribacter sp.]
MDKYLLLRLLLNFFELLAAFTGIIYWQKLKQNYWKWFVIYLVIIATTELVCEFIGYVLHNRQLNAFVNIYFSIPFQFIFFFWLFYKWFQNPAKKKLAVAGFIIYTLSLATDFFYFRDKQLWFFSFSYITGNVFLLVLTLFFLFDFIRSEQILYYRSNMMFWVCIGLLIFYLGSLPLFGLWNTLAKNYPAIFNAYWMILINLNYLMYLCFTISFIWGSQK